MVDSFNNEVIVSANLSWGKQSALFFEKGY